MDLHLKFNHDAYNALADLARQVVMAIGQLSDRRCNACRTVLQLVATELGHGAPYHSTSSHKIHVELVPTTGMASTQNLHAWL